MPFQLDFGIWGHIFAVPTAIVDEHIRLCGAASLKVLLVLLRHNQRELDIADIAQYVGLSNADTQDALNYWIASGVIKTAFPSPTEQSSEPFAPVTEPEEPPSPALSTEPEASTPQEEAREQRIMKLTARPKLTQESIAQLAQTDSKISTLIQEAQVLLGKPLSPSSTESLISLYSYGGMPVELILMVMQYCVSIEKSNVRYIETTAYDWIDRGIDTFDKAERHIKEMTHADENEKKLRDALNIHSRDLTSKEAEFARKWLDQYQYDTQMIKLAYERTIDSKGKMSFPYCDGILSKWHEKGVLTPKQAVEEMNTPFTPLADESRQTGSGKQTGYRTFPGTTGGDRDKYTQAHALLQQRRNDARDTAVQRKIEIHQKLPRVKEIDALLSKTGFEVSKAVLMGGDTGTLLNSLKEKNLSLQAEKEQLLLAVGYPADYLELPSTCKQCGDKGYRPDGETCVCLKELLQQSGK